MKARTAKGMAFGDVCAGWTPANWARELRRKADVCGADVQDLAIYYRRWAAEVERRHPPIDLDSPQGPEEHQAAVTRKAGALHYGET